MTPARLAACRAFVLLSAFCLVACNAVLNAAARAASLPATASDTGMVVADQRLAAEVGVTILRQGGNAIDAAVAVGYAEAVVNPCCGNIGGGGFMTAHLADGHDIFLDFRETAPAAAGPNMYLDAAGQPVHGASLYGWKAVAVPGTVLGLETALTKYGSLPRAMVMAPAIRLAREGFALTPTDADILAHGAPLLRRDPTAARLFLQPDGTPYRAGAILRQPELAATLQSIAERGPDAFYAGEIPRAIEAASRTGGGIITAADFAAYRAADTTPLRCTYHDNVILSAPPPSSGGTTLCEILNILEGYNLRNMGFHAADSVHVMAEAMRFAYFDRDTLLGDPNFVENPLNRLLSKDYAARLRGQITDRATPSTDLGPAPAPIAEKPQTTHYSVIDRGGNAVAVTYTINGGFGAGVAATGTGFLLNDEMDDFTIKPGVPNMFGLIQGPANAIAPGKRPLSSMAPTIVLANNATKDGVGGDGKLRLVLGSPGGSRIITIVLEVMLNILDFDMKPQEAVDAPRIHQQWMPDVLHVERFALSPDTQAALMHMGYRIQQQSPWGAAELIEVVPAHPRATQPSTPDSPDEHREAADTFYGANDARRPAGAALAP